ncbi:BCD family MFS transporter [Paracoccus spongiarum]|uniref:BCD family MFS transporter n=1 Tax=Paracoccus spongiarum TaxID=3064387 RepID=A0ABT9JC23_9RHOB|nr:BCD family MFS transporter [Paracoccus sp. 2205BS29-5]MDP5307362.1 BCD family MFS transporter [Paracoccus sp. 2205BS29-5]
MGLGWLAILRLGLVQMALGSVVVLTTSTLNRLMVVELALPAILPGLLVGWHYAVQISRPSWGLMSDRGGRRTRWIIGGMSALAGGATAASLGVVLFATHPTLALAVSVLAYGMIGMGVGAARTSLLALLAGAVAPHRRAAAATITWLMMIAGIALTAGGVGAILDPYSPARLMRIVLAVCTGAVLVSVLALWGIERAAPPPHPGSDGQGHLIAGLREIWAEPQARHFTIFVFLSMCAYFMQELILEPYAGLVFAFTPGQSTALGGAQHLGVFLGMLGVGIAATGLRLGSLRSWVVLGCTGSAASLLLIALLGNLPQPGPLVPAVVLLGLFNGIFAVAAIGSMMALAGEGRSRREGTRMGLWGAAQAVAAGFGGLAGAAAVDLMRRVLAADAPAFATVFLVEAALFLAAALLALRVIGAGAAPRVAIMAGE